MTTAVAPETARARADAAVADLQKATLEFLEEHKGSAALSEVLAVLRESGQPAELVSRALAKLIAQASVGLTTDRRLVLRSQ